MTSPIFTISCGTPVHGWMDFRVHTADGSFLMRVSDATDALGDLVRAAIQVAREFPSAELLWDGEPTAWHWKLIRSGDGTIDARVDVYASRTAFRLEHEPEQSLFRLRLPTAEFAQAVADAATALRDTVGTDGYLAGWRESAFPTRDLQELQRLLGGANSRMLFVGSRVENLRLEIFGSVTGDGPTRECEIRVRMEGFSAVVPASVQPELVVAFATELTELVDGKRDSAGLTMSPQAYFAVNRTDDGLIVSGRIGHEQQRALSFQMDIWNVPLTQRNLREMVEWLDPRTR